MKSKYPIISFSESGKHGSAVISPEEPNDGPYFTLIGAGTDEQQNALAAALVEAWNRRSPAPKVEREAIARIIEHYADQVGYADKAADAILALLSPSPLLAEGVEGDAWDWLAEQTNLSLDYEYGEPEDDGGQWEVLRVSGGVNDREWEFLASGKTPLEAVQAARAALSPTQVGGLGTRASVAESTDAPAFGAAEDGSYQSEDGHDPIVLAETYLAMGLAKNGADALIAGLIEAVRAARGEVLAMGGALLEPVFDKSEGGAS